MSNSNHQLGFDLLRELNQISHTQAPLTVPAYTWYFVHKLANATCYDEHRLSAFVSGLPMHSFRDGLIRLLLNEEAKALLKQLEQLALEKEHAIEAGTFELAAEIRQAQHELLGQLNHLVPTPIEVLPQHINQLLRDLGYNGALPNPT